MMLKLYILSLVFFTQISQAQDITGYVKTEALSLISKEYKYELLSPQLVVDNMPRIRSQGPINVCYGCAAATILQKYICDTHPDYVGKVCSGLPLTKEVSTFDMTSWTLTNKDGQSRDLPSKHKNLRIKEADRRKVGAVFALVNSIHTPKYLTESCSTSNVLSRDATIRVAQEVESMLAELETYHSKTTASSSAVCKNCYENFVRLFESSINPESFERAFQRRTFGEVLYSLVFSKKCDDTIFIQDHSYKVEIFPKNEPSERGKLVGLIIEAIGTPENSRPVLIDGVCLFLHVINNECLDHSLVISGYKYLCKKPGLRPNDQDCILAMKVQNCWGASWQKDNDDGWVDANRLIMNINRELPQVDDGALTWLRPR